MDRNRTVFFLVDVFFQKKKNLMQLGTVAGCFEIISWGKSRIVVCYSYPSWLQERRRERGWLHWDC